MIPKIRLLFKPYLLIVICFVTLLFVPCALTAQEKVNILFNTFGDLKIKDIKIRFDDGIWTTDIDTDTTNGNKLLIEEKIFAPFGKIFVHYDKYYYSFLVDAKPAVINLHLDRNDPSKAFYYKDNLNAEPLYDTVANPIYRDLRRFQHKELYQLNDMFIKNGKLLRSNDSIKTEFTHLVKALNDKTLLFLKKYPNEYLSYYYFTNQVLALSTHVDMGKAYNIYLLDYLKSTFPNQYQDTPEGKRTIENLEQLISKKTLTVQSSFPDIKILDINGIDRSISTMKGKFVLVDFWATWCGPCLKQIPTLQKIRETILDDKLEIISISADRDSIQFTKFIHENNMNWHHVYDKERFIANPLAIDALPTVLLINPEGKIVYQKTGGQLNLEEIKSIVSSKNSQ